MISGIPTFGLPDAVRAPNLGGVPSRLGLLGDTARMVINVESPEIDAAVRLLARRTGRTPTEAIDDAVREKLDRLDPRESQTSGQARFVEAATRSETRGAGIADPDDLGDEARVYVVTGADSGLGRAVANRLTAEGRVITCGLGEGVDVRADLTTHRGRTGLIEGVRSLSGGRVDGLVATAGMGAPHADTVALNHFGTIAVLQGLHPCLVASDAPAVVVVSSSSTLNRGGGALVRACLSGDEGKAARTARHLIRARRGSQIYRSSKIALNLWLRSTAVSQEWAGQGVVLNAVAPGIVATETAMRTWQRNRELLETALPQPLGAPGPVETVADLLAFTVSPANRFMTGQIIYCDGGTDALLRGTRPLQTYLRYRPSEVVTMLRAARRSAASN